MGLDIYFYRGNRARHEEYLKSYADYRKKLDDWLENHNQGRDLYHWEKDELKDLKKQEPECDTVGVAYFRKVNFLLPFFNYGENCSEVYITQRDVDELIRRCKEVLQDHDKADALLPTESGFFFGGTKYDDYYYRDVRHVLEVFEGVHLNNNDPDDCLIMYCWW